MILKDKKVLLVGLGILGGGEALARFLLKEGAKLSIADLRSAKDLSKTINKLPKGKIKFLLGEHKEKDFIENDIIVFNPAVSAYSKWAEFAKKIGKPFFNDMTLFLKFLETKKPNSNYIGITGTRGKTTSTLWAHHFHKNAILGGNMPDKNLLSLLSKKGEKFVLELSSYQLEYLNIGGKAPKVAVITNLYNDHLNRYGTIEKYLEQKAKIFLNQSKDDFLILNSDDKFTNEFLKYSPKSQIYYFSLKKLPKGKNGLYFINGEMYFTDNRNTEKITLIKDFASHEKYNLLTSMLSAYLFGLSWSEITKKIKNLPQAEFRQQIVLKNKKYIVVNDSAGTSPDATIAAIEKFSNNSNPIFIIGGTDKNLDFSELAKEIKNKIKPTNLFLLSGTGTKKLIAELDKNKYKTLGVFEDLNMLVKEVSKIHKKGTIIFSPSASSFEKFKNEFDRGRKFTFLAKKYLK